MGFLGFYRVLGFTGCVRGWGLGATAASFKIRRLLGGSVSREMLSLVWLSNCNFTYSVPWASK